MLNDQDADHDLASEISALRREVERLNEHRFIALHNSPVRLISYQFARGLAFGFGTVVGASIFVSLIGYMLASIDFIPVIGEWASQIAAEMNTAR